MTEGGVLLESDQLHASSLSSVSRMEISDKRQSSKYNIMSRPGSGSHGRHVPLLINHLRVSIEYSDATFHHYSVKIISEENKVIENKSFRVKIVDKLWQTYVSEFNGKRFVFDGAESLYYYGSLLPGVSEFTVMLEGSMGLCSGNPGENTKKSRHSLKPRLFKVELNYSGKIQMPSAALTSKGDNLCQTQDVLRVLNCILRQQAINKGCLLVRQSFFDNDSRNHFEVGGGVTGMNGFHSSFHLTKAGLSLKLDVSMTLIVSPGPVLDFLLANQNVQEPRYIDWVKAKRMLKKLRIKTRHSNREFKILGLSEKPCYQQRFTLVKKSDNESEEEKVVEITVFEYFLKQFGVELTYSKYMPCLDVGKPNRPIYLPIELCSLVSLQRYKKDLSAAQLATVVEKTKLRPHDRMKALTDALKDNQYENEPMMAACGVSIEKNFIQITGRVLEPPKLKVGRGEDCTPCNGRWNFKNKQFLQPVNIECWAIVNFSSGCDTSHLSRELISCGRSVGMNIDRPYALVEENQNMRKASPLERVDEMFERLQDKLPGEPEFILCVLPERRSCDLYGPWKMRSLCKFGIVTQCVCPMKVTERYLLNVLIKMNSKLGGINSLLAIEDPSCVPRIMDNPTMILGMDVCHGPSGRTDVPSIAAVVGSLSWPLISRYRAVIRTQSPRTEIIDTLFKPLENGDDDGIIRELLKDFYSTSNGKKPTQIIVFRDGVSESQFNQVLNIELEQIKQAYVGLGEKEVPKFTVIIAQKNHHTRLFEVEALGNVPAGTIVDTDVVHARNYDFYMCAHGGMTGTLRPVHYHVLLDEIGFSTDELQNFIHSLSYVYQRSNHATSLVAPISYAHHAARQVGQFVKCEDFADSAGKIGPTSAGSISVPKLPSLHDNVKDLMFFC